MIISLQENTRKRRRTLGFLLIACLIGTLMGGSLLWVARIAWTFLAIIFTLQLPYAIFAISFFAAFFSPTGFLQSFFFTLKHFQAAAALTMAVHLLRQGFLKTFAKGLAEGWRFYPALGIIGLGLLNYFIFARHDIRALRTPLNLLSTLVILIYFLGLLLQQTDTQSVRLARHSVSFFVFGCILQVGIAAGNTFFGTRFLDLNLLHNNHLGMLCASAIFLSMGAFGAARRPIQSFGFLAGSLILFSGIVLSCSRTSWFSFSAAFIFFIVVLKLNKSRLKTTIYFRRSVIPLTLVFCFLMMGFAALRDEVWTRFFNLPQLFDREYWHYVFQDKQNFGCFGIFRLNMIHKLKEIVLRQPLIGIGFTHEVMDFHGFFWTVLGGSGAAGFAMLIVFLGMLFRDGIASLSRETETDFFFLRLGALSALLVWILCSLMETYFLQFAPWYGILALVFLLKTDEGVSRQ